MVFQFLLPALLVILASPNGAFASLAFAPESGVDCIKCPTPVNNNNDDNTEIRRKRSFSGGPGFDFSMSMGDVIEDMHSFSMSFQDEFDAFGGLFPGFSRLPAPSVWWQGPNVCVREESKTTTTSPAETSVVENAGIKIYGSFGAQSAGSLHFRTSYCVSSSNSYKCNTEIGNSTSKTITSEIHECCQGYARIEDDDKPGCNKALNLVTLEETMDKLELTKLKDALGSVGLLEIVKTQNVTIFAPTDEAMAQYEQEERSKLASYTPIQDGEADLASSVLVGGAPIGFNRPRQPLILDESIQSEVKSIETTILGHLVPGFLRSSSLADEQLVETLNGQAKMRINMYEHKGLSKKLVTVNCAPVTSVDNQALNGIVHIVDRIVRPPTKGPLMDMIAKDPEFSILKSLIGQAGLTSLLREEGSLTIFAPTNDAFHKLPPKILKRLNQGKGDVCVRRILEMHLLPSVICSSAIAGEQPILVHNKLKDHLNVSRVDDKVFIGNERAQVTLGDIMASNGVMHVVDAVLLPRQGLDLVDVARRSEKGAMFADLLPSSSRGKDGLKERLETINNLTVFVPSIEAFRTMDIDVMDEMLRDSDKMEEVLKYHVVPESSIKSLRDLREGEPLRTWNLKNPLSVQELNIWPHGRVRTIQCANIISRPIEGCNGNIVLVDKVLVPPTGNVIDVLALNSNLTSLVRLLKTAGLADELQGPGPFTVFAPNDEAFRSMRKENLQKLERDPQILKTFLKNHIVQGVTCCSLIRHGSYVGSGSIRIPSLAGEGNTPLRLHSFHGLHNFVNQAQILECDSMGSNGVVHVINDVLKPRELQRSNPRRDSMDSFFRRIFDGFHLRHPQRRRGLGGGRRDDFFQMP